MSADKSNAATSVDTSLFIRARQLTFKHDLTYGYTHK